MHKPKSFDGPIPHEVRYTYNGRIYWLAYFKNGLWSVDVEDDAGGLIRCYGDWLDAIEAFERN